MQCVVTAMKLLEVYMEGYEILRGIEEVSGDCLLYFPIKTPRIISLVRATFKAKEGNSS